MKIIIEKETKIVKYLLEDDLKVILEKDKITTIEFNILDLNINNAEVIENITAPNDYEWNKFTYENWEFIEIQTEDTETPNT